MKWRTHLASAAAGVAHTGGNGGGGGSMRGLGCVGGGGLFGIVLERGDSKLFEILEEMANMFDFCSRKGGKSWWWWKWCGDGSMYSFGCVFDIILERGDSKLFQMLPPGFWVGCLVK
jgi:hypothetical protein